MKKIIIYSSEAGSTEKYAKDIASAVNADVIDASKALKKWKKYKIDDYDLILYMSWIRGGMIVGASDFLYHYDDLENKEIMMAACGMSFPTDESRKDLININHLDPYHIRFYQLQGSFNYNNLSKKNKMLMKLALKQAKKTPEISDDMLSALDFKNRVIEQYDANKIERIIYVIRQLEKREVK